MNPFPGFYVKNQSEVALYRLSAAPWSLPPAALPKFRTKSEYRKWCLNENTDHVFFSFVEPVDPNFRVSNENPPLKVHGLAADWDSETSFEEFEKRVAKLDQDLRPQFVGRTFSGNLRAVWMFSEPVWADCEETSRIFVRDFFITVKARALAGGFDDASLSLHMVWELGSDWREIDSTYPVPKPVLDRLRVDSIRKVKKVSSSRTEIPLEAVQEEIEKQFPGRLFGAKVEVGTRIPLFWVPLGDGKERDRSAMVAPWGVYSFSSRADKGRLFWDEVLGKTFVRKYEEARVSEGASDTYYDGHSYWWKSGEKWVCRIREDAVLRLKNLGFSATRKEGETASEADQVLYAIQQGASIDGAVPFTHTSDTFVEWNGRRFLNTNTRHPLNPAPEQTGNPENFPWLHEYFSNFLDRAEPDIFHPAEFLLTELQRAYTSLLANRPSSGHVLVFAGPPGRGKSLFTTVILRKIFGSAADAGSFLVEGKGFNKEMAQSFIWYIDDNKSAVTASQHKHFSETLKKHVATPEVTHQAKYHDGFPMPWYGRIVLTCNDDPESLGLIPDLDRTIKDKLSLFLISSWQAEFLPNEAMNEILERELPFFLRWLVSEYTPPDEILTPQEPRYGLLPYHHPELVHVAQESSSSNRLVEILEMWRHLIQDSGSHNMVRQNGTLRWVGTATQMLSGLNDYEETRPLVRSYTPIAFGRALNSLFKTEVYPYLNPKVRFGKSKQSNEWEVTLDPPTR